RTTRPRVVEVQRVMTGPEVMAFRELVREVPLATHVRELASYIVLASHPQWDRAPEAARRFVRYGSSPRGAQALVLGAKVRALSEGRYNVSVDDLRSMAMPALRHRLILNFEGEAEGVDADTLIDQLVEAAESVSSPGRDAFVPYAGGRPPSAATTRGRDGECPIRRSSSDWCNRSCARCACGAPNSGRCAACSSARWRPPSRWSSASRWVPWPSSSPAGSCWSALSAGR